MANPYLITVTLPGDTSNVAPLIQAAIDAAPTGATVIIDGKGVVSEPIFVDKSHISLDATPGSALSAFPNYCGDIISCIPRNPRGVAMLPSQMIDSTPFLDGTAGQRYGFHLDPNSQISMMGTTIDKPKGRYVTTRKLTIDAYVSINALPSRDDGRVVVGAHVNCMPWGLMIHKWGYQLVFYTSDGVQRMVNIGAPMFSGPVTMDTKPHRIHVCIDLDSASVTASVDRKLAKVDTKSIGPGWSPGLSFNQANRGGFMLNCSGGMSGGPGPIGVAGDISVFGFQVTGDAVYVSGNVGDALKRVDGKATNDYYTYFRPNANYYGLLPMTDAPAKVCVNRIVAVQTAIANRFNTAYFVDKKNHGDPYSNVGDMNISNLHITGGGAGAGIKWGYFTNSNLKNLSITTVAYGLCAFDWGSNYSNRVVDSQLQGMEAAMHFFYSSGWSFSNIFTSWIGREAVSAVISDLDFSGTYYIAGFNQDTFESAFHLDGSTLRMHNLIIDNENMAFTKPVIDVDTTSAYLISPTGIGVIIDNFGCASIGTSPILAVQGTQPCRLKIDNMYYQQSARPCIRIRCPKVYGNIECLSPTMVGGGDIYTDNSSNISKITVKGIPDFTTPTGS